MNPPANLWCTHDDVDLQPEQMVLTEFDFFAYDGGEGDDE